MNVVLLGPSGVGKGTHADALAAGYRLRHLATGDLFRQNVSERTALGRLAQKYLERAELVPDEIVEAMIDEWADQLPPGRGAFFDGFPRTPDQVRFLDELLARLHRPLDAAIYLKVDDNEVVNRVVGREVCRTCGKCFHVQAHPAKIPGHCDRCGGELLRRPDDTAELARARLTIFHRVTEPILADYARRGKLLVVSGEGTIPAVAARLAAAMDELAQGQARFVSPAELRDVIPLVPPAPLRLPSAHQALDLVIVGGPGSGKGTQAERLASRLRVPHIATGDLFRQHLQQASSLGTLAKAYMDRGELVPDDLTDAMVEQRLTQVDADEGFVLDGFPRNLRQAHALAEILFRLGRRLSAVLYIDVADNTIIRRLSGRLVCRSCQTPFHRRFNPPREEGRCDRCGGELYQRADDNPETVGARLVTYHRQTEPLIAYYGGLGLLQRLDGEREIDAITAEALAAIGPLAPARGVQAAALG